MKILCLLAIAGPLLLAGCAMKKNLLGPIAPFQLQGCDVTEKSEDGSMLACSCPKAHVVAVDVKTGAEIIACH